MAWDWAEGLNIFEIFVFIVGGLLGIAVPLAVGILCLLLLGGVLWSPVAGTICGVLAGSRGLAPIDKYVFAGIGSSCCLFGPWVYLVSRLQGKALPISLVMLSYCMLFLLWAFGTWVPGILLSVSFFWVEDPLLGPFSAAAQERGLAGSVVTVVIATMVPAMSSILWGWSLYQSIRLYRQYRRGGVLATQSVLIEPVYSRPFKLAAGTFVLFLFGSVFILVFSAR